MYIKSILVSSLLAFGVPVMTMGASAQSTQKQSETITGVVVDETGEPLIGATIRPIGKEAQGAVTDLDGKFTLRTSGVKEIEVTYVGYRSQRVSVTGKKDLRIVLVPTAESLDELVVVGYGTQKKESLTGAISQIKGDEVYKNRGVTNTATALQGEIPGLTVTRGSTRPGSEGASMQIRGSYSINGGGPQIIIDGQAASLDELNQIDGNDIENISVLKDASAAIYGARSAGGVILVTTKRGKNGKAKVSYSGSYSRTIDGIKLPITNNKEWLDMFYEAQYR
ncbi:MAG: TonB-dependent receptor plug domain-containing protein, partial [Muribaculaceae bacterium]|nr:TonB-dependent receptor plug domain-containing protein [Muribaculaceae bacterium]